MKGHTDHNIRFYMPTCLRGQDPSQVKLRLVVKYDNVEILRKDFRVGETFVGGTSSNPFPKGKTLHAEAWILNGSTVVKHLSHSTTANFDGPNSNSWDITDRGSSTVDQLKMVGVFGYDIYPDYKLVLSIDSW